VGTFKTTLSRADLARAPQPGEMSAGSWTLVIGNRGGPGNERALAIGPGDTDRAVYRFGIHGNRLSIGCTDNHGLPTSGSQTYLWSIHERALTLTPASAKCKQGDPDTQLILTRHTWTKQGTH
jgi:hypothetical protein